jgi:hypothetical protein
MSKCRYCGSGSYGKVYDSRHPNGVHVHTADGKHCIYCGSSSIPTGKIYDNRHPNKLHEIQ